MSNTIENKVAEFVAREEGFTSVNIANAIKRDGTWIANREVAAWLRSWNVDPEYTVTRINVTLEDGSPARAAVYMPESKPVSEYTGRDERAMTPDEFETMHGYNPVAQVVAPAPQPTAGAALALPSADADDGTTTKTSGSAPVTVGAKLRDRFNFPAAS